MTCVAGIIEDGKIWIGADSVATRGNESVLMKDPKVFKSGSFLFGCSGNPRDAQILQSSAFNPPKIKDRQSVQDYLALDVMAHIRAILKQHGSFIVEDSATEGFDSELLMGFGTDLYVVYGNFQIARRIEPYNATGCGMQYALGAFHSLDPYQISARKKIEAALKAAARFDPYVQGPFKIMSMKVVEYGN